MFKIGFSKTDIEPALSSENDMSEERIEAVAVYFESLDSRALWVSFDFMDFSRMITDSLRRKIASVSSLCDDEIHILTTHNHGGGRPDVDALCELAGQCALEAIMKAEEATIKIAATRCDKQISVMRRLFIPELCGVATLYFGASEKNNFNSLLFKENVIKNTAEFKECHTTENVATSECVPFLSGDDEIVALEFLRSNGETIGSIVRFACHAVCSNRSGVYSSDYPYHVRRVMQEALGGISIFLNGPCAEIAPAIVDKYEGGQKRIGEYIATLALRALSESEAQAVKVFKDSKAEIKLPVREELLNDKASLPIFTPETLPEKRKYLENARLSRTLPFLRGKYSEGEEALSDRISVYLGLLQINDLLIVAFPGETFSATGKGIKKEFSDLTVCTVTEHERTVMYLPPLDECEKGGYESVCRVTAKDAESILSKDAVLHIKSFLNEKKL